MAERSELYYIDYQEYDCEKKDSSEIIKSHFFMIKLGLILHDEEIKNHPCSVSW